MIEDQGEKQLEALGKYGKQLVDYRDDKETLTHSKQKEILEELANRRMEEIQNLSKQIDFNNLGHHYQNKSIPKKYFIGLKGPLRFYKSIKEGNITL